MKKFISTALITAVVVSGAALAQAQTMTMPTLYDASGNPVNTSGSGSLNAGWYYLQPGGQGDQVYYYGNGTYYNPTTGQYGGSTGNPSGTAGVSVPVTGNTGTGGTFVPGVPNTGLGGDTLSVWLTLLASGAVAVGGAAYLARRNAFGH